MFEDDVIRIAGSTGEAVLARVQEYRALLQRPVGTDHIDAWVLSVLRGRAGERVTAREIAEQTHLALESVARSLARVVHAGGAEGDDAKPRTYRWIPFPIELPFGFKVARPAGKSWSEQIASTSFYPDGERVELFVVRETQRVHDGGGAALRMNGAAMGAFLQQLAAEQGVRIEGDELFVDPATKDGVQALAQASADVVMAWMSTAPLG